MLIKFGKFNRVYKCCGFGTSNLCVLHMRRSQKLEQFLICVAETRMTNPIHSS